ADTFALGGSVSLNKIANTLDTHVAAGANVLAAGTVRVTATDDATIDSLAGGVAVAGGAAIGAALATNDIDDTVQAYIDASAVTSSAGSVELLAASTAAIEALTVGGAGADTFAL